MPWSRACELARAGRGSKVRTRNAIIRARTKREDSMRKLSMVVALAFACSANAQQFDGTWTGQTEGFSLRLTVTGTKARLEMTCSGGYQGMADFAIGPDGAVNTYISVSGARGQVTGTVQAIKVPGGLWGCGSGTVTMTKKS
jgi:hypothetical protein